MAMAQMKQVLKRLLSRKVEGDRETLVYERIEKEVLTDRELEAILRFTDDPEDGYYCFGVALNFSDEIEFIELEKLRDGISDWLKDEDDCDVNDKLLSAIIEKIGPYVAFELHFEVVSLAN